MAGTESDLLSLREVLVGVPVELKFAYILDGHQLFRPNLGCVKNVKFELVFLSGRGTRRLVKSAAC